VRLASIDNLHGTELAGAATSPWGSFSSISVGDSAPVAANPGLKPPPQCPATEASPRRRVRWPKPPRQVASWPSSPARLLGGLGCLRLNPGSVRWPRSMSAVSPFAITASSKKLAEI